jgi:hypothetical protein
MACSFCADVFEAKPDGYAFARWSRERLVSQRTGVINQIRALLLERGVAVRLSLSTRRAAEHSGETHRGALADACLTLSRTWQETGDGWMSVSRAGKPHSQDLSRMQFRDQHAASGDAIAPPSTASGTSGT